MNKNLSLSIKNKLSYDLLKWYAVSKRKLPWRSISNRKTDPYRIWISEIMLQQTTVVTVIPYYERFIQKWPTIDDLSSAPFSEILTMWSGLGYYRRARNIHLCVQIIQNKYGGDFPSEEKELIKLPGIGSYTAAAISSIAFNKRSVVVDGNVQRIIARLFLLEKPVLDIRKLVWNFTNSITPENRSGDFAQAMMDLGSMICSPNIPKCDLCPLKNNCKAYEHQLVYKIPVKKVKAKKSIRNGKSFIIKLNKKLLFYKRLPSGLLPSMHSLPSIGWDNEEDNRLSFIDILESENIGSIIHQFTHFKLVMEIYYINMFSKNEFEIPKDFYWITIEQIKTLALPSLMKKILIKGKVIIS